MNHIFKFLLIFSVVAFTNSCSIQRAEVATKAQSSMIGMSKQQILECMGAASNTQSQGNAEVWNYHSGGDYRGSVNLYSNDQYTTGTAIVNRRSCEINVVFENGIVSKILYSGRTGGILSRGEQCAFAVANVLNSFCYHISLAFC